MTKVNNKQYLKIVQLAERYNLDVNEIINELVIDDKNEENIVFKPDLNRQGIIVVLADGSSHT